MGMISLESGWGLQEGKGGGGVLMSCMGGGGGGRPTGKRRGAGRANPVFQCRHRHHRLPRLAAPGMHAFDCIVRVDVTSLS